MNKIDSIEIPPLSLNKYNGLSYVLQVKEQILDYINSENFSEGAKLPSERDLAKTSKLNVAIISRAFRSLEDEGYLIREVGRGTFIRKNRSLGKVALIVAPKYLMTESPAINTFSGKLLEGLTHAGYKPELLTYSSLVDETIEEDKYFFKNLAEKRYVAVINHTWHPLHQIRTVAKSSGIPFIEFSLKPREAGQFKESSDSQFVITFNFLSFFEKALTHLSDKGSSKPLYLGHSHVFFEDELTPAPDYIKKHFHSKGLSIDEKSFAYCNTSSSVTKGYELARKLLSENTDYDSILVDQDTFMDGLQIYALEKQIDLSKRSIIALYNKTNPPLWVLPVKRFAFNFIKTVEATISLIHEIRKNPNLKQKTILFECEEDIEET
jgi:DNA-binding transcriptional regulator YhcF (GntR family)